MNLSIVDWFGYNFSPRERMRVIKRAGFSGVMLLWADYFDEVYNQFPEYARTAGLNVENAHAPYKKANHLWKDTIDGDEACKEIISCIEDCANYDIPTLVMHAENKAGISSAPLPLDFSVGIERFNKIIEVAERLNINVAIENMTNCEYLERIFNNVKSDKLGFCFDSGHQKVFTPDTDFLSLYGDKLTALHLHDNNGIEDMHALPFTGIVDWSDIKTKLNKISYQGSIALEVNNKGFEHINDPEKFLAIAVERAERIMAK